MLQKYYYYACGHCDYDTESLAEFKTHLDKIHFPDNNRTPINSKHAIKEKENAEESSPVQVYPKSCPKPLKRKPSGTNPDEQPTKKIHSPNPGKDTGLANSPETANLNSPTITHNCTMCSFSTTEIFKLVQHKLEHFNTEKKPMSGHNSLPHPTNQSFVSASKDSSLDDTPPKGSFRCSKCSFTTTDVKKLVQHKLDHFNNKIKPTSGQSLLTEPTNQSSGSGSKNSRLNEKIKVEDGPISIQNQNKSEAPSDTTPKSVFACLECNFTTRSENKFEKHTHNVHVKNEGKTCDVCQHICESNAAFKTHMNKHRQCSLCSYISKSMKDIKKHLKEKHGEDFREELADPLFSPELLDLSLAEDKLKKKAQKKETKDNHQCPVCDFSTKSPSNAEAHLLTCHPNDPRVSECLSLIRSKKSKMSEEAEAIMSDPAGASPRLKHIQNASEQGAHFKQDFNVVQGGSHPNTIPFVSKFSPETIGAQNMSQPRSAPIVSATPSPMSAPSWRPAAAVTESGIVLKECSNCDFQALSSIELLKHFVREHQSENKTTM